MGQNHRASRLASHQSGAKHPFAQGRSDRGTRGSVCVTPQSTQCAVPGLDRSEFARSQACRAHPGPPFWGTAAIALAASRRTFPVTSVREQVSQAITAPEVAAGDPSQGLLLHSVNAYFLSSYYGLAVRAPDTQRPVQTRGSESRELNLDARETLRGSAVAHHVP